MNFGFFYTLGRQWVTDINALKLQYANQKYFQSISVYPVVTTWCNYSSIKRLV